MNGMTLLLFFCDNPKHTRNNNPIPQHVRATELRECEPGWQVNTKPNEIKKVIKGLIHWIV